MKIEKKIKKWSLAKWKREFWEVFAEYIKARDKNICFTCGRKVYGSEAHAGHFQKASICGLILYFHEDNVHCQCYHCNINLDGNQYEYGKRLGEKAEWLISLLQESKKAKWDKLDYVAKIAVYKLKLKQLTK